MKASFPSVLKPPAVDSPDLAPPLVINQRDVKETILFPDGGGKTKFLLTEENAGCRFMNMGLFNAEPGQGSQWHTHPQETEEEEYLYILKGSGTLTYKQGGRDLTVPFKEGEAIFTGHLTHFVKNTGAGTLSIFFSIAPLPMTTVIYGVKNDKGPGFVDSVNIRPPQLVRPGDVQMVRFAKGGIVNWRLLYPEIVGGKIGRLGIALEKPGMGSSWHTHPQEIGEEDLFYIARGKGTMFYLQGGEEHRFEFREGDAIHSRHLTNYTWNTGSEDLWIPFVGAPNPPRTMVHE